MKRKLLIFLGILTVFTGVVVADNTYAKRYENGTANGDDATKCDVDFLGFNAWWNGLGEYMTDKCEVVSVDGNRIGDKDNAPAFVWTIVLNVLHDLFMAIGYISIAMIIFGGYLYITSSGEPGKAIKARKTLTSAVIGLILVLTANVTIDTIVGLINPGHYCTIQSGLLSNVTLPNCDGAGGNSFSMVLASIFSEALSVGAIMATGFIIYGGISYITSNGSPDKARKALRTLIFAAIGLVIVVVAAVITNFVMSSVDNAVENAMITTIWKG